jgi:hypothetical protein
MPTPFTHLAQAQRLLTDPLLPTAIRSALQAACPAFLLGSVAADARTNGSLKREDTHFYSYDQGIHAHPWRVMMERFPQLWQQPSADAQAFLAGYVAHLSVDEIWSLDILGPHFAGRQWAPDRQRFLMLHVLLMVMDERDRALLEPWQAETLSQAAPEGWIPFMTDGLLAEWRDFIGGQLPPVGDSQTLAVFGQRINYTPAELRTLLDDAALLERDLWAHIPQTTLAAVEAQMYAHARQELMTYWSEAGG